jgi:hypothetical protein
MGLINIYVTKEIGEVSALADFSIEMNVGDAIIALESTLAFVREKVDAKARSNGFDSAKEAPKEFTQDLTFNEVL